MQHPAPSVAVGVVEVAGNDPVVEPGALGDVVVVPAIGVQATGTPSQIDPFGPSGHMPCVAPITGQTMFAAVASPAHDASGLLGFQAVHSQKPKLPIVVVKETMLDESSSADPKYVAWCKQHASAFQCV